MADKVLDWDRAITPQETGYWCGPAATQIVLNARGIKVAEADLAREIGTHVGGTDHIGWITDRSLRHRVPQANYTGVWLPNDPPNQSQRDALWEHITRSINAGWGLVVNWVVPVNNRPQPIKGSQRLQYPAGGTSYHYVAYMGYGFDGDRRAVFVADSGFRPFESWISFDQACTLIPPKAYAWAAASPAVGPTAPPIVTPPPAVRDPLDTLIAVMGNAVSRDRYNELLPYFLEALGRAQCDNVNRIAMWCAQLGHESAGLKYMREIHDGSNYEGRQDLGNTQPGDGVRFAGRGPIQLTGRSNYTNMNKWAFAQGYVDSPTLFVEQPQLLETPKWGFLGTVWYWIVARPQINAMSDRRDLEGVTRAINGGLNGLADRRQRWDRALAMGDRLLDLTGAAPAPPGEGFLMSLTPDEQRDVYNWIQGLAEARHMSISPLRHLDEAGNKAAAVTDSVRLDFIDGNVHVVMSLMLALAGDAEHLALLAEVASADGDPRYPERQHDARLAKFILAYAAETGREPVEPPPGPPPFVCLINNTNRCAIEGSSPGGPCMLTGGDCARTVLGGV